jgi:hypothetical protein
MARMPACGVSLSRGGECTLAHVVLGLLHDRHHTGACLGEFALEPELTGLDSRRDHLRAELRCARRRTRHGVVYAMALHANKTPLLSCQQAREAEALGVVLRDAITL